MSEKTDQGCWLFLIEKPNDDSTDQGCWLFLIEKPPTRPPPKFSIHWSVPWGDPNIGGDQIRKSFRDYAIKVDPSDPYVYLESDAIFGKKSPNFTGARAIIFDDTPIRIFPHEYSIPEAASLLLYLGIDDWIDMSHKWQPLGVSGKAAVQKMDQDVYDAARVDGLHNQAAILLAMGSSWGDDWISVPPVFWFELLPQYADLFGHSSWEQETTPKPDLIDDRIKRFLDKNTSTGWAAPRMIKGY